MKTAIVILSCLLALSIGYIFLLHGECGQLANDAVKELTRERDNAKANANLYLDQREAYADSLEVIKSERELYKFQESQLRNIIKNQRNETKRPPMRVSDMQPVYDSLLGKSTEPRLFR